MDVASRGDIRWEICCFVCYARQFQGEHKVIKSGKCISRTDVWTPKKNLLWVADLTEGGIGQNMKWIKVINEYKASYELLVTSYFQHASD